MYLFFRRSSVNFLKSCLQIRTGIILMSSSKTLIKKNSCLDRIFSNSQRDIFQSKETVVQKKTPKNQKGDDSKNDLSSQNRRQMKKKDPNTSDIQQKLRKAQEMAEAYKSEKSSLEYNINFYKLKLQEECQNGQNLDAELKEISQILKKCISKMNQMKGNNQVLTNSSISIHVDSVDEDEPGIDRIWRMSRLLENQTGLLETNFILRFQQEEQRLNNLVESLNLELDKTKNQFLDEKQQLLKKIKEMEGLYQAKATECQEKKREVSRILEQRQFNRDLLVSSEKNRIVLVNDIYKIGKSKYNIDFADMSKSEVSKFCLQLFSKIDELQRAREEIINYSQKIEVDSKTKYEDLLKQVKDVKNNAQNETNKSRK